MKPHIVALLALAGVGLALPATATTMPAIDHPDHTLALGSGGSQGAGLAFDFAPTERWRLGLVAGNHVFTHLYAYSGVRGAYLLSEPGSRLSSAIIGSVYASTTGPVLHTDGTMGSIETQLDRYSLGMSWAYAFTPQWVGRFSMGNLSDFFLFGAFPWNLLLPFYGQDTGVELAYRINPGLEVTVGCNTAFDQLLGVSWMW